MVTLSVEPVELLHPELPPELWLEEEPWDQLEPELFPHPFELLWPELPPTLFPWLQPSELLVLSLWESEEPQFLPPPPLIPKTLTPPLKEPPELSEWELPVEVL